MAENKKHLRIECHLPMDSKAAQRLLARTEKSTKSHSLVAMQDLAILYGDEPGIPGLGYDKLTDQVQQLQQQVQQLQQEIRLLTVLIQTTTRNTTSFQTLSEVVVTP
jgi:hypothetical protein